MKKLVVVLAGMLLLATPALAGITNSAHDIPQKFPNAGETSEICVYCHTPHNAVDTPLWNRTAAGSMPLDVYSSVTLNATMPGDYTATDAELCMGCHDGTIAMDALSNTPNSDGYAPASGNFVGDFNADAILDNTWANDHPIGFDYSAAAAADGEILDPPNNAALLPFFGGEMWCSTCHDVHNAGAGSYALLNYDNNNSNLCLSCHDK